MKRLLTRLSLGLLALVLITGAVLLVPPSWPGAVAPPTPGKALARRCEVVRDRFDVPHISAPSAEETFFCWGATHATDRAWQLDYLRRAAYGRLAERYGSRYAQQDFLMRLLDLRAVARRWLAAAERDHRREARLLAFYTWGINHGLTRGARRSYQLRELGFEPAPWRPEDSLALGLLQSFFQTRKTFTDDLRHAARARRAGRGSGPTTDEPVNETVDAATIIRAGEHPLAPASAPASSPAGAPASSPASAPASAPATKSPATKAARGDVARALLAWLARADASGAAAASLGQGSNSWVVAGHRSDSGHALLANDPHLQVTTPSFWYETHLRTTSGPEAERLDVIGIGVPGLPALVAGHNRHVAWGVTNGYSNVADVLAVKLERNERGERFRLGDEQHAVRRIRPVVRVRFGPLYVPVFWKTFATSEIGPLLPLPDKLGLGPRALLRWSAFHLQEPALAAALGLMRARNVTEADRALRRWTLPCWNIVFADRAGRIGMRQVGLVPRREAGTRGLLDPTDPRQRWDGFLSADEMPALLDPPRGFIATANNRPFPRASYPHFVGHAFAPGYRARRIERLLAARPKQSLATIKRIQLDALVPEAEALLPAMLGALGSQPTGRAAEAARTLGAWDRQARRGATAPTIFRAWLEALVASLYGADRDRGPRPEIAALGRRLARGDRATRDAIRASLGRALTRLGETLGPDPTTWRWGRYHRLHFRSLLDDRPGWQPTPEGVDGDRDTVNVGPLRGEGPYEVPYAASYRVVIELGRDRLRSEGVLAGKQIDASPKVLGKDQRRWIEGRYRPRPFYPDEIERQAKGRETITF